MLDLYRIDSDNIVMMPMMTIISDDGDCYGCDDCNKNTLIHDGCNGDDDCNARW